MFINGKLVRARGYIFKPTLVAYYEDVELSLYSLNKDTSTSFGWTHMQHMGEVARMEW